MSEDNTSNPADTVVAAKSKAVSKVPFKKRGNNKMPSQRVYKTRKTREMKKSVEVLKGILKVNKLTPSQRSSLAYFLNPWEREEN